MNGECGKDKMTEVVEEKLQSKQEAVAVYEKTHKALEDTRVESRAARLELIEKIMCDEKDVLAPWNIQEIQAALVKFLEVQERLGRCWFENANADARMLWAIGGSYDDEPE